VLRVEFADGTVIVADAEHQWRTETTIRTTAELAASPGYAVANARPLELPERDLPLPPYTLGELLGTANDDLLPPAYRARRRTSAAPCSPAYWTLAGRSRRPGRSS